MKKRKMQYTVRKERGLVKKVLLFSFLFALFSFLLFGCFEPVFGKNELNLPEGYGLVRVDMPQTAARAFMPDFGYELYSYLTYDFIFTPVGGGTPIQYLNFQYTSFTLPEGNYTLEVNAFLSGDYEEGGGNIAIAKGSTDVTINSGMETAVTVTMKQEGEGEGRLEVSLECDINLPYVDFYVTSIYLIDLVGDNDVFFLDELGGFEEAMFENTFEVDAGYYLINVIITNSLNYRCAARTQVVHILEGLTTKVIFSFIEQDLNCYMVTNNKNEVTPGSLFAAVGNADYGAEIRIILPPDQNKIAFNECIEIDGKEVTIIALNDVEFIRGEEFEDSFFNITTSVAPGKLTLTTINDVELKINGAYDEGESTSSIINVSGTFIMDGNVHLTGNTTSGNGGAVYVSSGGTFNMYDGTISHNTAESGGGVSVERGMFTMNGGYIRNNVATGDENGSYDVSADGGGGVFVDGFYGNFKKTNGIIYGYSSENKNEANNYGQAVFVQGYNGGSSVGRAHGFSKKIDQTVGEEIELECSYEIKDGGERTTIIVDDSSYWESILQ